MGASIGGGASMVDASFFFWIFFKIEEHRGDLEEEWGTGCDMVVIDSGDSLFALDMLLYKSTSCIERNFWFPTSNIIHDCDEVFNYW